MNNICDGEDFGYGYVCANIYMTDGKHIVITGRDFGGAIYACRIVQSNIKNNRAETVQIFGCIIRKSLIKMIIFTDSNTRAVIEQ